MSQPSPLEHIANRPRTPAVDIEKRILGPAAAEAPPAGKYTDADQLAEQYQADPRTVPCNTRIPEWLDEEVNRKVRDLKSCGAKKVSKQVILTEALKAYLKVQGPS